MRRAIVGFALTSLAVVAFLPAIASAAGVNRNIYLKGQTVGTITMADPTVFIQQPSTGGVTVSGSAQLFSPPVVAGRELRWVQIITTNVPLNTNAGANVPYFDPGELDPTGDADPFYWNTTLAGNDSNNYPQFWYKNKQFGGGTGITFFDEPKRTWSGPAINWQAELSLVCWETGSFEFEIWWTGTYGFDISNTGVVTINGINELAAPALLTQARLTSYFDDWSINEDCECFPHPEPGTLALVAIGSLGLIHARRRRKAA